MVWTEARDGATAFRPRNTGASAGDVSWGFSLRGRYRNFRTFTSPRPTQFSCVAVDSSGEIVCAGAQDSFEIFIWSMQTGRLLEVRAARPRSCALEGSGGGGQMQEGRGHC